MSGGAVPIGRHSGNPREQRHRAAEENEIVATEIRHALEDLEGLDQRVATEPHWQPIPSPELDGIPQRVVLSGMGQHSFDSATDSASCTVR